MIFGFIDSIWDTIKAEGVPVRGELSGQKITTERNDIDVLVALDENRHLHLLVWPAPKALERLTKLSFKGLEFTLQSWEVSGARKEIYLDIICLGDIDSSNRRPFSKFCEDVIFEIDKGNETVEDSVYRTSVRWKNFWGSTREKNVSLEWERGLIAELLTLEKLVGINQEKAIRAWVGPNGADHDFTLGNFGLEVKSTLSLPARIQVNNLRQLDCSIFEELFLCLYQLTPSREGISLRQKAYEVESLFGEEFALVDIFWSKLREAGYQMVIDEAYDNRKYKVESDCWYIVDDTFPKITEGDFVVSLDQRIETIRYLIRLTDIPRCTAEEINRFCLKLVGS